MEKRHWGGRFGNKPRALFHKREPCGSGVIPKEVDRQISKHGQTHVEARMDAARPLSGWPCQSLCRPFHSGPEIPLVRNRATILGVLERPPPLPLVRPFHRTGVVSGPPLRENRKCNSLIALIDAGMGFVEKRARGKNEAPPSPSPQVWGDGKIHHPLPPTLVSRLAGRKLCSSWVLRGVRSAGLMQPSSRRA